MSRKSVLGMPIPLHVGHAEHDSARPHAVKRAHGTRHWLVEYVAAGGVSVRLDDRSQSLSAGDMFMYEPGVLQDYRMAPSWEHYWYIFEPEPHWRHLLDWPRLADGVGHVHIPAGALRRQVAEQWQQMLWHFRSQLMLRESLVANCFHAVLLWSQIVLGGDRRRAIDTRVQMALELIGERYAEPLRVEDIAGHCALSESRLSHLFRSDVGVGVMGYLQRFRLDRAAELLTMTAMSIAEVAYAVGYDNPLYFTRLFTRRFGHAPRVHRRRHRTVHDSGI